MGYCEEGRARTSRFDLPCRPSLAGGEKQELHTDFGIFDFPRFAGVISFSDDTTLQVKPNGKAVERTVWILSGKMILFRGDLKHGVSASGVFTTTKENNGKSFRVRNKC